MSTGVEKEEEEEHHLQQAINKQLFIPTPDASTKIKNYSDLYPHKYNQPRTLIKSSLQIEELQVYYYL